MVVFVQKQGQKEKATEQMLILQDGRLRCLSVQMTTRKKRRPEREPMSLSESSQECPREPPWEGGCMKGRLPGREAPAPTTLRIGLGPTPAAATSLCGESRCLGQAGFLFLVSLWLVPGGLGRSQLRPHG